ncbi:hypothetical protein [Spirosoma taeanense]|nr:hypothetical protein [Spirosoma taeanense]
MGSNILEERMLEDTLVTFRDADQAGLSPAQGVMLIDGWLQALQGNPKLSQLEGSFNELRAELQASQPNNEHVRQVIERLAGQAQQAAEASGAEGNWTGNLESLAAFLRNLGRKL